MMSSVGAGKYLSPNSNGLPVTRTVRETSSNAIDNDLQSEQMDLCCGGRMRILT